MSGIGDRLPTKSPHWCKLLRIWKLGLLAMVVYTLVITLWPGEQNDLKRYEADTEIKFRNKMDFIEQHYPNSDKDRTPVKNEKVFQVFLWTSFFGDRTWTGFQGVWDPSCPFKCVFTYDKSKFSSSDVVLFNARNLVDAKLSDLPMEQRSEQQIWVLYNAEPPHGTLLHLSKWNNVFNWTSMVREDSDVVVRYSKAVLLNHTRPQQRNLWKYTSPVVQERHEIQHGLAAWRVSNCYAPSHREELVYQLQKHIPIDIHGNCGKKPCPRTGTSCDNGLKNYTFYLAFENSVCRGYVTEKLWNALKLGIIPVTLGSRNVYTSLAPAGSYIHVNDFSTTDELAHFLQQLHQNRSLTEPYLEWRKHYAIVNDYWCEFCEQLHLWNGTRQWYTDLHGWHSQDTCTDGHYTSYQSLMITLHRVFFVVRKTLRL